MILWTILAWLANAFIVVLLIRVILSWLPLLAPDVRLSGGWAALAEVVYSITDPPLKLIRKVVPNLTLGRVQLDLGVLVLFVLVSFLGTFASALARV